MDANLLEFQLAWAQTEFCLLSDNDKQKELTNYQNKLLELANKVKHAS